VYQNHLASNLAQCAIWDHLSSSSDVSANIHAAMAYSQNCCGVSNSTSRCIIYRPCYSNVESEFPSSRITFGWTLILR
jgi:hypothetical protein